MNQELKSLLDLNPNIVELWVNADKSVWYTYEPVKWVQEIVNVTEGKTVVEEKGIPLDGFKKVSREELLKGK